MIITVNVFTYGKVTFDVYHFLFEAALLKIYYDYSHFYSNLFDNFCQFSIYFLNRKNEMTANNAYVYPDMLFAILAMNFVIQAYCSLYRQ
jgi:hypothetical protein